ncbi:MAG TPA: M23 family metallopeptidase [Solirubrobacter sp.]|nr:M23 family metallopeptidase [Solirubrobacter sp.]
MSDIQLLRPTTGPLSDTFAEHAARYPARVARGDYSYCGQDHAWHTPDDWPVYASHDGTVDVELHDPDYGHLVTIVSPLGYKTRYAHLSVVLVKPGQQIRAGHRLGTMGATGNARGIHLHHELIVNGMQTDPAPYYLSPADWAAASTQPITTEEDDMIVKRIRRDGIGEFYLFVSPTIVSLSRELSTLSADARAFEDRVATALNGGRTPDYWDETPNGSWYLRNQLAAKVAGMPTDYPLAPGKPFQHLVTVPGAIKDNPPAGVDAETIAAAVADELAERLRS